MGKRRKETPEERAERLARGADIDRRLTEMIEKYRRLSEEKRAAEGAA